MTEALDREKLAAELMARELAEKIRDITSRQLRISDDDTTEVWQAATKLVDLLSPAPARPDLPTEPCAIRATLVGGTQVDLVGPDVDGGGWSRAKVREHLTRHVDVDDIVSYVHLVPTDPDMVAVPKRIVDRAVALKAYQEGAFVGVPPTAENIIVDLAKAAHTHSARCPVDIHGAWTNECTEVSA